MEDSLISAAAVLVKDLLDHRPLTNLQKRKFITSQVSSSSSDDDEELYYYTKLRKCKQEEPHRRQCPPDDDGGGGGGGNHQAPSSVITTDNSRIANGYKCPINTAPKFIDYLMNCSEHKFFSFYRFSRKTFYVRAVILFKYIPPYFLKIN